LIIFNQKALINVCVFWHINRILIGKFVKGKKMKKSLLLLMILGLLLGGCGTTLDNTSDDDTDDAVPAILQTSAIDLNKVLLQDLATNYLICTETDAAEVNATIQVYKSYPFSDSGLLGTATCDSDGTFFFNLGTNDADINILYVLATAPGKSVSDPIIITNF